MRTKAYCRSVVSALAIVTAHGLAHAQPAARETAALAPPAEDIVVTARKRAETIVDVPIAITVLPREILRAADIVSPSEAVLLTPTGGEVTTDAGANQRFQLRGIGGAQGVVVGEPGVAVYVDEVYASGARTNYPDFFDLERIEVLRGPQGALYGRNAVGGAINILTASPDPSALGGRVELRYGTFDRFEARGELNVPITGRVAARGVGWYVDQSGGEYYNGTLKQQIDRARNYGGRFSVGGHSDGVRWRVIAEGGRREGPSNIVFSPGSETPSTIQRNSPDRTTADDFRLTAQAFVDTPLGEAAVIYGFRDYILHLRSDDDYTALIAPNTNADQRQPNTRERVRSHFVEARLTGSHGSLKYLFGLNYYNEAFRQDALSVTVDVGTNLIPLACNLVFASPFAPGGYAFVPIQALNPAYPLFRNCADTTSHTNAQSTDSYAAFGEITYSITHRLDVTGSIRWSEDDKRIDFNQLSGPLYSAFFPNSRFGQNAKFDKAAPSAVISWRPLDATQLYVKYGQGFRAGGFNATLLAGSRLDYGQENFDNYEVGARADLFDKRLLLALTAYRLDQRNLVVPTLVFNSISGTIVGVTLANAGRARTDGIELEARARLAKTLFLSAGLGLLDPKFRSGLSGALPLAGIDLPGVATRSGYVLGTWTPRIMDNLRGELTTKYKFRSGGRFRVDTPDRLASFDQLDMSAGVTFRNINIVGFVDNVTDQKYQNNLVGTFSGLSLIGVSPGRRGGVRLNATF